MDDFPQLELTRQTIGIAFRVYNALGYGVREQYIHRALCKEFDDAGIAYQHEVVVPLIYRGEQIGNYRLDFVLRNELVVEIKVVPFI